MSESRRIAKLPEPEEAWLSWVIDYATRAARPAWMVYHTRYSKGSHAGFPDLVLVRAPRLLFAELKTDATASKLTRAQEDWRDALDMVSAFSPHVEWHLWRPDDRPAIARILA